MVDTFLQNLLVSHCIAEFQSLLCFLSNDHISAGFVSSGSLTIGCRSVLPARVGAVRQLVGP